MNHRVYRITKQLYPQLVSLKKAAFANLNFCDRPRAPGRLLLAVNVTCDGPRVPERLLLALTVTFSVTFFTYNHGLAKICTTKSLLFVFVIIAMTIKMQLI